MQLSLPFRGEPILQGVRDRLISLYGPQRDALRHDPTAQWVKAMISARTLDEVSNGAFCRLSALLSSWDLLADIKPTDIAAVIHDVRFAADKAARLIAASRIIEARCGRVDLGFLAGWPTETAFDWLTRLPGTGPKVAGVTLNFSTLRRPVLAIDTHVLRVFWRMGFAPSRSNFKRGYVALSRLVPNDWDGDDLYEFHWLVKKLGQEICRHRLTLCDRCPLALRCAAARDRQDPAAHAARPLTNVRAHFAAIPAASKILP